MGNVFEYLEWRGDLTFARDPFNDVDNLILSALVYLDFSGIVPEMPGKGCPLSECARLYFSEHPLPAAGAGKEAGSREARERLLWQAANCARFSQVRICAFRERLDRAAGIQFCAASFLIGKKMLYIAFRGTADDLVGWKEDFLLSCLPQIPSHREATEYCEAVALAYPDRQILLGGHSKGGNLAVYAAVRADAQVRTRIERVFSNDGPGFLDAFLKEEAYREMEGRIETIVPRSSVVGMLLGHTGKIRIVDSTQRGLLQHDCLSWQVQGISFRELPSLSVQSIRADRRIRSWLAGISEEERLVFVDTLFDLLSSSGAQTLSQVERSRLEILLASLPRIREVPMEVQVQILQFMALLRRTVRRLAQESLIERTGQRLGKLSGRDGNPEEREPSKG